MGQLEDLRLFVHVIEAGSISKAATSLGIAKSAVSRRLGLLETRYDAKLIARDPGRWEVTRTGQDLFRRATQILHDMDEVDGDFMSTSAVITGPLTVSLPREFGISFLSPALIAFRSRYPEIRLTIDFDDRPVDLVQENYDLAIRIMRAGEQGENATQIATARHHLYASRTYLSQRPAIADICDLNGHQLLNFGSARRGRWDFLTPSGKPTVHEFTPALNSNSGLFLLAAVKADLGIARLPDFITQNLTASDPIDRVLPDTPIPELGIHLIHAEHRRINRRMRLFAQEMKQACVFLHRA